MSDIRRLIIISHRRKKNILGLCICSLLIMLCIPILQSISLGEGTSISHIFQHQITEIIGLIFLLYFGTTTLYQYNHNKIIQLLRSKKKNPISFIFQIWGGTYSIYIIYTIITMLLSILVYGLSSDIVMSYINLIITGGIILTITMLLSLVINSYMAMIGSLIIYSISYSINFIIFSTPASFQEIYSFKILTVLQYLFPRFDILYSTTGQEWIRSIGANGIYGIALYIILVRIFLYRYDR